MPDVCTLQLKLDTNATYWGYLHYHKFSASVHGNYSYMCRIAQ